MVQNVKSVKEASNNRGMLDFIPTLDLVYPDIFVVNAESGFDAKHQICAERGIPHPARGSHRAAHSEGVSGGKGIFVPIC